MVLALLSIHLSAFTCALYAADPSGVGFQNIDPVVGECLSGGHKAASSGNFDEAIKIFSACAEKHPNSAVAHFFLGMAYLHKKETEKATGELKKASQLDPNNMEAAVMLGRLYSLDEQKRGLARELLERALTAEPHRDDVRFDLARVYALTGEEKKSLQEFHRGFLPMSQGMGNFSISSGSFPEWLGIESPPIPWVRMVAEFLSSCP